MYLYFAQQLPLSPPHRSRENVRLSVTFDLFTPSRGWGASFRGSPLGWWRWCLHALLWSPATNTLKRDSDNNNISSYLQIAVITVRIVVVITAEYFNLFFLGVSYFCHKLELVSGKGNGIRSTGNYLKCFAIVFITWTGASHVNCCFFFSTARWES